MRDAEAARVSMAHDDRLTLNDQVSTMFPRSRGSGMANKAPGQRPDSPTEDRVAVADSTPTGTATDTRGVVGCVWLWCVGGGFFPLGIGGGGGGWVVLCVVVGGGGGVWGRGCVGVVCGVLGWGVGGGGVVGGGGGCGGGGGEGGGCGGVVGLVVGRSDRHRGGVLRQRRQHLRPGAGSHCKR